MNDDPAPHPRWQHPSQQSVAARVARHAEVLRLLHEEVHFWLWEQELEDTH